MHVNNKFKSDGQKSPAFTHGDECPSDLLKIRAGIPTIYAWGDPQIFFKSEKKGLSIFNQGKDCFSDLLEIQDGIPAPYGKSAHAIFFKIIVRANSPKNEVLGYDREKGAYRVNIKAKPQDNKANVEIIRFFSRTLKKKVSIVKGIKSREKILRADRKE
ncbi:DUF167 domain-containing protein [Candidatus Woesearchaeota archaeon]|nr:DUF167 domain-containing protein [Candidatus Woesearchaeota archaeon]